tara:strand:- start:112 stop:372 length:261 start_codon:yes stop_codon:yes gene_type:complete
MGIRERLSDYHGSELLFANDYDSCIVGVSVGCHSGRVVYDIQKMVEVCMKGLESNEQEAWEWLEFNTFHAYVGENTPIFVDSDKDL